MTQWLSSPPAALLLDTCSTDCCQVSFLLIAGLMESSLYIMFASSQGQMPETFWTVWNCIVIRLRHKKIHYHIKHVFTYLKIPTRVCIPLSHLYIYVVAHSQVRSVKCHLILWNCTKSLCYYIKVKSGPLDLLAPFRNAFLQLVHQKEQKACINAYQFSSRYNLHCNGPLMGIANGHMT